MKRTLIILSLFLVGCSTTEEQGEALLKTYLVLEIDGCEYIFMCKKHESKSSCLANKGNCKFCEKRNK